MNIYSIDFDEANAFANVLATLCWGACNAMDDEDGAGRNLTEYEAYPVANGVAVALAQKAQESCEASIFMDLLMSRKTTEKDFQRVIFREYLSLTGVNLAEYDRLVLRKAMLEVKGFAEGSVDYETHYGPEIVGDIFKVLEGIDKAGVEL